MEEIDFADLTYAVCDCCGSRVTRLTRFVTRGGRVIGAYYLNFSDDHDPRQAYGMAGLGDWSDLDDADGRRVAIAFTLQKDAEGFRVAIIDANASPWRMPTPLGRRLSRIDALASPMIGAVYALSDRIVAEDRPLLDHFRSAVP